MDYSERNSYMPAPGVAEYHGNVRERRLSTRDSYGQNVSDDFFRVYNRQEDANPRDLISKLAGDTIPADRL